MTKSYSVRSPLNGSSSVKMVIKIVSIFFIFTYFLVSVTGQTNNVFNDTSDANVDLIDTDTDGRIVNGTKADFKQFPYQVSLRRMQRRHFCGGSIVGESWILTAAHCVAGIVNYPNTVTIVAGQTTILPELPYSQRRFVEKIFVHEEFDRSILANDVALLRLASPLNLNESNVQAIKLAEEMPMPGTVCEVSGWGYLTEDKRKVSNDLMYIQLPIINNTRCQQLLEEIIPFPDGHFCAGYEEGFMDACQGDSGGGVICGNVLAGVVSNGEGCARPKLPGTYADVSCYQSWAMSVIENNSETEEPRSREIIFPTDSSVSFLDKIFGRHGNGAENIRSSVLIYFICTFVFIFNSKNFI